MRIAFDIGGVLGKYPSEMGALARILALGGAEIFVITDIPDRSSALEILNRHGIAVAPSHVLCADWAVHGERCKAVLVAEHKINILIDDHPGYCADAGCIALFVWPNPHLPYEAT